MDHRVALASFCEIAGRAELASSGRDMKANIRFQAIKKKKKCVFVLFLMAFDILTKIYLIHLRRSQPMKMFSIYSYFFSLSFCSINGQRT